MAEVDSSKAKQLEKAGINVRRATNVDAAIERLVSRGPEAGSEDVQAFTDAILDQADRLFQRQLELVRKGRGPGA
jgi:hypothetical protein